MNIPFFCIFLAFIMNYLSKYPVAIAMAKSPKGYDNELPREQQAALTGWGKRALAAHLNGFEIFPPFAAAVLMAHIAGLDEKTLSVYCITFIVSRIAYISLYLANKSTWRSLVWAIGAICVAAIMWQSMFLL